MPRRSSLPDRAALRGGPEPCRSRFRSVDASRGLPSDSLKRPPSYPPRIGLHCDRAENLGFSGVQGPGSSGRYPIGAVERPDGYRSHEQGLRCCLSWRRFCAKERHLREEWAIDRRAAREAGSDVQPQLATARRSKAPRLMSQALTRGSGSMVPPPCVLTTGWRRGHHAPIDFDRQGATSAGPPAEAHPYCSHRFRQSPLFRWFRWANCWKTVALGTKPSPPKSRSGSQGLV